MNMKTVLKRFDRIDASSIADSKLSRRVKKLQAARKQGGFTLLELLVVVAIMAAIAGSVVVAFQDTDARAAAAAHVQMMNELNGGTRHFEAINFRYPDHWDSLTELDGAGALGDTGTAALNILGIEDIAIMPLNLVVHGDDTVAGDTVVANLDAVGITTLRVAYDTTTHGLDPDGEGDCDDYTALIASKGNAVVAGNIYLSPDANGCGGAHTIGTGTSVMVWTGGAERITGQENAVDIVDAAGAVGSAELLAASPGTPVLMALGYGPSGSLFDPREVAGMSTVPVYRHVGPLDYNRFIALFQIGTITDDDGDLTSDRAVASAAPVLLGVVDGAGDTKEEELGEWDGTRSTI